jgi:hypothetical protein
MRELLGRILRWMSMCLPAPTREVLSSSVLFLPALLLFAAQLGWKKAKEDQPQRGKAGESLAP